MNAQQERALLARAHALADLEDLAEETTNVLGGARAARLDPDAVTGLAGAALALGADSLTVYRAEDHRFADDRELAEAIEETEADIQERATAAARLRDETANALEAARSALAAARAKLRAALTMPTHRPCDGCHAVKAAAITAARAHIADAQERIDVVGEALSVLDSLAERLRRALACIRRVLPDLEDVYEPVYGHVRSGGVMPADGHWLTGQQQAG